ncbi:hypothetical protein ABPG74_006480 [Tetrahymena malaccensis]
MQQQSYKNDRQNKKASPYSNKKNGQKVYQLQHPNSYDDQLSSILFSESQYSNKKPSKNKVYHTPEKKYDQSTQKKVPPQQYQMFQTQNNQIFGFNSHPLMEDRGQPIGEYKWHLPQRQQFPLQNQETNKKYFNQNSFQQEQNSNAGGEEQHSYIPSDNSSNIFDSMKSFSHSFNHGNVFNQQSSPFKNEQHFALYNNLSTNQQNQISQEAQYQSFNKGFTQSSSEGQLDSTDQIIKNMRADLLQVDFDMKKVIPNSNVQVICEDEPPQNFVSFSQNDYNHNLFNSNKQNNEGYLYHSSHVSPVDQEPSLIQDHSKRQSFNDISNLQIQINPNQNQHKMDEQNKYQDKNTLRFIKQNQSNQDSQCENYSSQRKQKKQGYDPIYMDIIQNIEASKQYLSCTQKCMSQQKDQKKQMHIYESILDENKNKKAQKQINSAQKSTSQPKYSSTKKQSSYYSAQVLDSIQKKRQMLLQNSSVKYGKSQSPKLIHNQSLDLLSQSPTTLKKNNSIGSKLSLLKDLTQRHIQNLPLTSHLSSLKKQSQSPNQKNSRSGFEVCTFLKDPSGKSLIRPDSLEKAIQENHNKTIVGSVDFKQRYEQELNQARQKLQQEEKLSIQLDNQILQFNEDQKNIRQLILQTDSKVNKLEIRNKKLKSKWVEQGLNWEQINDQDSKLQRLRDQEQKNQFIISELERYNGDMKIQLEQLLKQIEIEKSIKTQTPLSNTKQHQNALLQDESQLSQIKMLENTNSLNNTLSLPSSPFTIIGGSFSVKNQLLSNKNVNMQFNQCPKSDDSLNNIVGNSFDQQDQMISHLIQKYSPSPKKSQATPSQSNQTVNTCSSQQSENKYKPQNTNQIKNILQSRGLHDIMEEPSDDSKNSFLPLVNYQK